MYKKYFMVVISLFMAGILHGAQVTQESDDETIFMTPEQLLNLSRYATEADMKEYREQFRTSQLLQKTEHQHSRQEPVTSRQEAVSSLIVPLQKQYDLLAKDIPLNVSSFQEGILKVDKIVQYTYENTDILFLIKESRIVMYIRPEEKNSRQYIKVFEYDLKEKIGSSKTNINSIACSKGYMWIQLNDYICVLKINVTEHDKHFLYLVAEKKMDKASRISATKNKEENVLLGYEGENYIQYLALKKDTHNKMVIVEKNINEALKLKNVIDMIAHKDTLLVLQQTGRGKKALKVKNYTTSDFTPIEYPIDNKDLFLTLLTSSLIPDHFTALEKYITQHYPDLIQIYALESKIRIIYKKEGKRCIDTLKITISDDEQLKIKHIHSAIFEGQNLMYESNKFKKYILDIHGLSYLKKFSDIVCGADLEAKEPETISVIKEIFAAPESTL